MTVHLDRYDGELWCGVWSDGERYVTIPSDADAVFDSGVIADVTCEACLRAAIAFGERCINRLEHLRDPGCGPDTTFGYRRVVPPAGNVSSEDLDRMKHETDEAIEAVLRSELARACDEIWKRSKP